jgi:XapX domain-containing protein
MNYILSLITGIITGGIFTFLNFPLPAPNKIEGILGIIGIFLGYLIINQIKKWNGL